MRALPWLAVSVGLLPTGLLGEQGVLVVHVKLENGTAPAMAARFNKSVSPAAKEEGS